MALSRAERTRDTTPVAWGLSLAGKTVGNLVNGTVHLVHDMDGLLMRDILALFQHCGNRGFIEGGKTGAQGIHRSFRVGDKLLQITLDPFRIQFVLAGAAQVVFHPLAGSPCILAGHSGNTHGGIYHPGRFILIRSEFLLEGGYGALNIGSHGLRALLGHPGMGFEMRGDGLTIQERTLMGNHRPYFRLVQQFGQFLTDIFGTEFGRIELVNILLHRLPHIIGIQIAEHFLTDRLDDFFRGIGGFILSGFARREEAASQVERSPAFATPITEPTREETALASRTIVST